MKICFPVNEQSGTSSRVHDHFGSAKYFAIYDSELKELRHIENQNAHHVHGTCQPLKAISGQGINAVMTNGMGKRAVNMLNQGGIQVYLLKDSTISEAVELFEKGELTELTMENACGGHGCH